MEIGHRAERSWTVAGTLQGLDGEETLWWLFYGGLTEESTYRVGRQEGRPYRVPYVVSAMGGDPVRSVTWA